MTKQETLDHVARQGAGIDVDKRAGSTASLVDVLSKQLLARSCRAYEQNRKTSPRVSLREHERPADGRRDSDDHRPTPFGILGAVTLSASASVLRIRGVRNKYSSVSVLRRSALPNNPPMSGNAKRIGIPDWVRSRCWSRRPPSTIVWPSLTSTCVSASRVEITGPSNSG